MFPVLIATVKSGGAAVYILLFVMGLALGWPVWRTLDAWEKKVLIGFSIFFILVSISLVNTHDFSSGIKKVGRYIHFPLLIPMYLLFKKYQAETGKAFLLGFFCSSVVMSGQAYYEVMVLGLGRAIGAYNPLVLGDVSMLGVAIIVCALLTVFQNWYHYLLGALAIGLLLFASVMSGSRGAWMMLPVVLIWLVWMKRKNLSFFSLVSIVIFGFLLTGFSFSFDKVKKPIGLVKIEYQEHEQKPSKYTSIGARLEMWGDSVIIWKAHPLIGTGIGDFKNDRFQLFQDGVSHMEKRHNHAHNIYFDVLATAGLVGLVGMVILMQIIPFQMFYSFWMKGHDPWLKFYALSGMTTILAFAVFGLTEGWLARNAFVRTYLMCILVFMSSIAVIKAKGNEVISHKS